jgi:hypothetical protein
LEIKPHLNSAVLKNCGRQNICSAITQSVTNRYPVLNLNYAYIFVCHTWRGYNA